MKTLVQKVKAKLAMQSLHYCNMESKKKEIKKVAIFKNNFVENNIHFRQKYYSILLTFNEYLYVTST